VIWFDFKTPFSQQRDVGFCIFDLGNLDFEESNENQVANKSA
jgi:hypothetical protein